MTTIKPYLIKILGLIILGLLVFWFVLKASGAPLHSPKGAEIFPVTNFRIVSETVKPPLVPIPSVAPVQLYTNTWYFAATAQDNQGLESDFSNEVGITNIYSNSPISSATLSWDPSPSTNVITNYSVYWGAVSHTYTNNSLAGTNLTVGVQLLPPPLTNCVLTVTTTGTNLYRSVTLRGPWMALNQTNYIATNLPAPYYFRGKGKRGNTVSISARMQ